MGSIPEAAAPSADKGHGWAATPDAGEHKVPFGSPNSVHASAAKGAESSALKTGEAAAVSRPGGCVQAVLRVASLRIPISSDPD